MLLPHLGQSMVNYASYYGNLLLRRDSGVRVHTPILPHAVVRDDKSERRWKSRWTDLAFDSAVIYHCCQDGLGQSLGRRFRSVREEQGIFLL